MNFQWHKLQVADAIRIKIREEMSPLQRNTVMHLRCPSGHLRKPIPNVYCCRTVKFLGSSFERPGDKFPCGEKVNYREHCSSGGRWLAGFRINASAQQLRTLVNAYSGDESYRFSKDSVHRDEVESCQLRSYVNAGEGLNEIVSCRIDSVDRVLMHIKILVERKRVLRVPFERIHRPQPADIGRVIPGAQKIQSQVWIILLTRVEINVRNGCV